ncbi:hypothetical protein SDC9_139773 [bioreactor metagenome]|uniref:Uncharacterized protein n=1 Tax=bioreactor metagenome TaxID=1076179 RepID=A0A645DU28_9ZZZZ
MAEIFHNAVYQQNKILSKISGAFCLHFGIRLNQHAVTDLVNQLLQYIALVFEIQIKSALCHLCVLHNLVYRGFSNPFLRKKGIGGVQQVLLFSLLFLFQPSTHRPRSLLLLACAGPAGHILQPIRSS